MGEEMGNTLSSALANKLLDELGLTNFMNPVPCDRYSGIFADTVNGWNSKGIKLQIFWKRFNFSLFIFNDRKLR
jgi:hypothetical protein